MRFESDIIQILLRVLVSLVLLPCLLHGQNGQFFKGDGPDSIKRVDTININSKKYFYIKTDSNSHSLIAESGEIIAPNDFYSTLELIDINQDGLTDIRVYFYTNVPNICDTYLQKNSGFIKIRNCYRNITKLEGTKNLYSTIYKEGCAGINYGSSLFKLKKDSLIDIAYISVNECDTPFIVKIYKIDNSSHKEILQKEMPLDKFEGTDEYWKLNYKNLLRKD